MATIVNGRSYDIPQTVLININDIFTKDVYEHIYNVGDTIIEYDEHNPSFQRIKKGDGMTRYGSLGYIYDSEKSNEYIRSEQEQERQRLRTEMEYRMNMRMSEEIDKINQKMNRSITYIHSCKACGARLEVPEDKNIFYCKYCDSTYVVGPVRLNSAV